MGKNWTPFDAIETGAAVGQLMAEAQWVMALRLWGFAGGWSLPAGEARRMMAEKGPAWAAAWEKAAQSISAGEGPAEATRKAAERLTRPARANRRRLVKRAMKS